MWLVVAYTIAAVVIAVVTGPIPGTSLLLTLLEVAMVYHIARRHQVTFGLEEIGCGVATVIGLAEVIKLAVSTLSELTLVAAYIVKPIFAGAFVLALGIIAERTFREKARQASLERQVQLSTADSAHEMQAPVGIARRSVGTSPGATQANSQDPQAEERPLPSFCPYCGQQAKSQHHFCSSCGTPLD